MNAENVRPTWETDALDSAGGPGIRVRRIGPPCGCLPGRDAHECGLRDPVRDVACSGRCLSFGIPERERIAELYSVCPCLLVVAS